MAYQVSIFLENKIGRFQKMTEILENFGVNIRSMTLTHTANNWGILNLTVNDPQKTYEILSLNGQTVTLREIVGIEMGDSAGSLNKVLTKLADAGINFTNAYGINVELDKKAYLVLDITEIENAKEKIAAAGLVLASDEDIYGK